MNSTDHHAERVSICLNESKRIGSHEKSNGKKTDGFSSGFSDERTPLLSIHPFD